MAKLFRIVGVNHGVTQEQIRQSLGNRRADLDLTVMVSFIVLYVWVANLIVRRIYRSADHRGTSDWIIMTVYTSVIASAVGVLLGEQWSGLIENIRLGNGHLSYRGERIPWDHYSLLMFVGGILVFWFLAALQRRSAPRPREINSAISMRTFWSR